ncbi:hypothetical protein Bbelb_284950 [Branchiostoma belcheri]|nr:hypothetical protein Bbelb_284950 [Branchiostoma belcheri]
MYPDEETTVVPKDEETRRDDVHLDAVSRQQQPVPLVEFPTLLDDDEDDVFLPKVPTEIVKKEEPKEDKPSPPPQDDAKKVARPSKIPVLKKEAIQPQKAVVEEKPVQEPRVAEPQDSDVRKEEKVTPGAKAPPLPSFTALKKTYAEVVKLGIMDRVENKQTRKDVQTVVQTAPTSLPKPQQVSTPSVIDVQRKTSAEATEFSRSPPKVQFEDTTVVMTTWEEEMLREEQEEQEEVSSSPEEDQSLSQEPNLSQEASQSSFESETDFEVAKLWKRSEMGEMPGLEEGKLYEATNFGDKEEETDNISTVEMLSKSPPKVRFSPVVEIIQTREVEPELSEQSTETSSEDEEEESSVSDGKDDDDDQDSGEKKDDGDTGEDRTGEPTGEHPPGTGATTDEDAGVLSTESELSASEEDILGEEEISTSEMETENDIFEELIQDNMQRMEELLHHKENLAAEKEQLQQQAALYSLAVKRSGLEELEGRVMEGNTTTDAGSDTEWGRQQGIEQLEIARKLSPRETPASTGPALEEESQDELEKVGSWNMEAIVAELMRDYYLLEAEWDTEASETEASEAAGPSASSSSTQAEMPAVPTAPARGHHDGFPSPPDMSAMQEDAGWSADDDVTTKEQEERYDQQRIDQSEQPEAGGAADIPWGVEEELPPPPFFDFSEEGAMEDYHRYYEHDNDSLPATDTSSIASSSRTASASDLAELLQEAASEDLEFLEKYSKEGGRKIRKRKVRVESDFRTHLEKILRKRRDEMSEKESGSSNPELVKMFRSESMESFLSKEPEVKKKIGGSVPSSPVPSSPAPSSPVPGMRRREDDPLVQLQQLFTGRPPTGRSERPKQLLLIRRKKDM